MAADRGVGGTEFSETDLISPKPLLDCSKLIDPEKIIEEVLP